MLKRFVYRSFKNLDRYKNPCLKRFVYMSLKKMPNKKESEKLKNILYLQNVVVK
jgi:hypothetical protein